MWPLKLAPAASILHILVFHMRAIYHREDTPLEFIEFKFPKINVWIVVFVMMVSILTDFVIEILQLLTNGYNSTYQ